MTLLLESNSFDEHVQSCQENLSYSFRDWLPYLIDCLIHHLCRLSLIIYRLSAYLSSYGNRTAVDLPTSPVAEIP